MPDIYPKAKDTIAAIASAAGQAARIVLRVSGPDALRIAAELSPDVPTGPNSAIQCDLLLLGLFVPTWLYVFRSPRSYTGEDSVEFHIPGNPVLARMLVDQLVRLGARAADPGEFTARAYFNGRMNLVEAEGVAATIAASSETELRAARQLLGGELARRLRPAMDAIAHLLVLIEVGIDFSDEGIVVLPADQAERHLNEARLLLHDLLAGSARFEPLCHEPRFVLAGRPNAGKSTLLNALVHQERAITSPVAGTTRDVLSAEVVLPRGPVWMTDLAGLNDPASGSPDEVDPSPPRASIEEAMRLQAMRAIEMSDRVILLRDVTDPRPPIPLLRDPDLTVLTKIDLLAGAMTSRDLGVSARTGSGLELLRQALDRLAFGEQSARATLALNARHFRGIEQAQIALGNARDNLKGDLAELIALDLREALSALGEILGQVTPDDLLGRIFSSFCIGK